jgi:Flp pilus assembly pilin Flp
MNSLFCLGVCLAVLRNRAMSVEKYFRRLAVVNLVGFLWRNEEGQDIAEYAVMLAVILVIVIGTVRLIGSNANTAFSQVASQIAQ